MWKVGDGSKTKLWEDNWLGEESLANLFPRVYLNSLQQHKFIKDTGWGNGEVWGWNLECVEIGLCGRNLKCPS